MADQPTILVVDDDPEIVRLLNITFSVFQFKMVSTHSGFQLIELVRDLNPDVILLDISLPDASGLDLISTIREFSDVPIIMISAHTSDLEKVTSLSLGADDYVVKPFSVAELVARVQRLLHRRTMEPSSTGREPSRSSSLDIVQSTIVRFELDEHRVYISDREIMLTNKEYDLLHTLWARSGKVVTKDSIMNSVWGYDNLEIETRAVDACVSRLRKKLKNYLQEELIETVAGIGYRLVST